MLTVKMKTPGNGIQVAEKAVKNVANREGVYFTKKERLNFFSEPILVLNNYLYIHTELLCCFSTV